MAVVFVLLLVGGAIYAIVVWQRKVAREAAGAQAAGRLLHLRSLNFPVVCSWCKSTSIARKLMVFEKVDERWRPNDIAAGVQTMADGAVEAATQTIFHHTTPTWRRFCTEKCVREFLASEHVDTAEVFGPCAYCSVRFPTALVHCPNCAAPRMAGTGT